MTTIGDRIRALREARDMKQFGLAVVLGTSQPVVSGWEMNRHIPSPRYLYLIAERLKVDPHWILFGDNKNI